MISSNSRSRPDLKSANSSQKAIRSNTANKSRISTSNKKLTANSTNASFLPNKYINEIDKQFPDVDLESLSQDKLIKLNEKLRGVIKRFNEELNTIIDKNMAMLKGKKDSKKPGIEDRIRVLYEQKKNNETMM